MVNKSTKETLKKGKGVRPGRSTHPPPPTHTHTLTFGWFLYNVEKCLKILKAVYDYN